MLRYLSVTERVSVEVSHCHIEGQCHGISVPQSGSVLRYLSVTERVSVEVSHCHRAGQC